MDGLGFPSSSVGEESACHAGDTGDARSIPGLGRSPGGRHSNPLQYSCLENPVDTGAWQATVHGGLKESDTTEVTEHAHDRWLNFQWLKQTGILFSFVIGNLDIVLLALIWKSEPYQQLPVLLAPPGCLSPLSHKRAPEVLESRSSLLSRKKGWEEDQYQAHWFLFSFT